MTSAQESWARTGGDRPVGRLLMISYGFLMQRSYQWKAVELARRAETFRAVLPERWHYRWAPDPVLPDPGPIDELPHELVDLWFEGDKHFALLPFGRLRELLTTFRPRIVDFDNEPFNLGSAQVMAAVRRYAPEARVYFHASQNLVKWYPPPFSWLERYVFRRCAGVFARSPAAADVLRRRGLAAGKIHECGHGVSLREFEEARRNQMDGGARPDAVLYVGVLTEQKGVDTLLRAVAKSRRVRRLTLAGEGPRREELEAIARTLEIEDRVRFLGRVGQDRLRKLYGTHACLVLPSRTLPDLAEQFGRVLIEAMAAGCPVVASDSGNIPKVVGDAGEIFPEDDVTDLARRLDRIIEDPNQRRSLREAGVERVRRRYEWSVRADQMVEVFRRAG